MFSITKYSKELFDTKSYLCLKQSNYVNSQILKFWNYSQKKIKHIEIFFKLFIQLLRRRFSYVFKCWTIEDSYAMPNAPTYGFHSILGLFLIFFSIPLKGLLAVLVALSISAWVISLSFAWLSAYVHHSQSHLKFQILFRVVRLSAVFFMPKSL